MNDAADPPRRPNATEWVDTHAHFWDGELIRRSWGPPAPLDRTWSPADWWTEVHPAGVGACIFVETGASDAHLRRASEWLDAFDFIRGYIAPVAVDGRDMRTVLARWRHHPKFRGVRAHFEDGAAELLRDPALLGALQLAADADVLFELLVTREQLRAAFELAVRVPGLRVVIEHMGKPSLDAAPQRAWLDTMRAFALDSAAVVKVSASPPPDGFAKFARSAPNGFPTRGLRAHTEALLELFGTERLVWGSDWPVSKLTAGTPAFAAGWHKVLGPLGTQLAVTAREVYRLDAQR